MKYRGFMEDRSILLRRVLISLPILSMIISGISWLRYGIDFPYYDDWRQYQLGDMGRLDLEYLFASGNDTLYPVGKLLDSLAFIFLNGNAIAYQFLSMLLILGGLLFLQWTLLLRCSADKNILAVAFSFTLLMLQPDTYWGAQSLAYHQAIPLVCVLGILVLATASRAHSIKTLMLIMGLGFVSGLSYISGALCLLPLCIVLFVSGHISPRSARNNLRRAGLALIAPAILTTLAQLWVIIEVQHGTHLAAAPMAFPWEGDFWWFMLGKVARSLVLPSSHVYFTMVASIVVVLILLLVLVKCIMDISDSKKEQSSNSFVIYTAMVGIVFVYLSLVSAGRANLRPETMNDVTEIFISGFNRFHYFWVTLLWPWLVCVVLNWMKSRGISARTIAGVMIIAVSLWFVAGGMTSLFSHAKFFKSTMMQRTAEMNCVIDNIQRPGPIICLDAFPQDIAKSIDNARRTGASFVRYLFMLPIPLGVNEPRPLFRFSEAPQALSLVNAVNLSSDSFPLDLRTEKSDPNLIFDMQSDVSRCTALDITASIISPQASVAQVFYLASEDTGFNELHSTTASVAASAQAQLLLFHVFSPQGFKNLIRFDPVILNTRLTVQEIEVRCRSYLNDKN